jgi:serine/threonine protein kinase
MPFSLDIVPKRWFILKSNEARFKALLPYTRVEQYGNFLYLITKPPSPSKDLVEAIVDKKFVLTEANLHSVFVRILTTVGRMHEVGLMHGQIIPSKILMIDNEYYLYDPCVGTESINDRLAENFLFLSPEELAGEIPSYESEVWTLGAVLYYFVTGEFVFSGRTYVECLEDSKKKELTFNDSSWSTVSSALKNLIKQMLIHSKSERLTISEVLQHEWIKINKNCLGNDSTNSLKKIESHYRRKKCIQHSKFCIANARSYIAIYDMQKICKKLDFNNTGYLEYGVATRSVFQGENSQCEDCDELWGYKIHHQNFVADLVVLSSLIHHERLSVIFEQLAKKKLLVGSEEIKKMLKAIGHPEHAEEETFERFVTAYQYVKREDHTLNFVEFTTMCQSINFIPNEGHVIGKFF